MFRGSAIPFELFRKTATQCPPWSSFIGLFQIGTIAVGQQGEQGSEGGGGGGGTFVVKKLYGFSFSNVLESHILLIAAGGAGAPFDNPFGQAGHGVYTKSGSGQGGAGNQRHGK